MRTYTTELDQIALCTVKLCEKIAGVNALQSLQVFHVRAKMKYCSNNDEILEIFAQMLTIDHALSGPAQNERGEGFISGFSV